MAAKTKRRAVARKAKPKSKSKTKTKAARIAKAKVPPIPKGVHTITPYIALTDCAAALKFYVRAFDAKEHYRLTDPAGRIGHAEIRIGDCTVMMSDEYPEMGIVGPRNSDIMSVRFHLTVKNADAFIAKAVKAGATLTRPIQDQFYGFRSGTITDPFGYNWYVSHQIEKVSPKRMQKRWSKMMASVKSS
jgi:PhnB protein